MQRRLAKGQAHISPPIQSPSQGPVFDGEKSTLLSQRTFGIPNRVWIVVLILLFLIPFTRMVAPGNHRPPDPYSTAKLKPKNYINSTDAQPNPFGFCPSFGPGDDLGAKYGSLTLSQSRLNLGSGARIQRLLHRALLGHPVTISIIGGSVSACHGAGDHPISPDCYSSRFFQWWNTVFPHPVSELTNGAMRRTNSAYFAYCSAHHIPDVTDLVILELDVDDTPDQESTDNFEILVRSLLLRRDRPAVLVLGHFSPQIHEAYGFVGPDHWHSIVAQFYDLPHISIKSTLYPLYMDEPTSVKRYYADAILANQHGHALIADILISYFQSQICSTWSVVTGQSYDTAPLMAVDPALVEAHGLYGGLGQKKDVAPPDGPNDYLDTDGNRKIPAGHVDRNPQLQVPPGRMSTRPNSPRVFEEIAPYCVSANDLINPLPPSLFYGSGWYAFHPPPGTSPLRVMEYYWYSNMPTSKLRIPIQVGAGDVGIYYLKEPMSVVGQGSAIDCWVDDNYSGARIIENAADIPEVTPTLEIIDHYVTRGSHYVECFLLGEEGQKTPDFKILGVFAT